MSHIIPFKSKAQQEQEKLERLEREEKEHPITEADMRRLSMIGRAFYEDAQKAKAEYERTHAKEIAAQSREEAEERRQSDMRCRPIGWAYENEFHRLFPEIPCEVTPIETEIGYSIHISYHDGPPPSLAKHLMSAFTPPDYLTTKPIAVRIDWNASPAMKEKLLVLFHDEEEGLTVHGHIFLHLYLAEWYDTDRSAVLWPKKYRDMVQKMKNH